MNLQYSLVFFCKVTWVGRSKHMDMLDALLWRSRHAVLSLSPVLSLVSTLTLA